MKWLGAVIQNDIGFWGVGYQDCADVIMKWQDAEGGVDTFMGLCKFPGREQRHRIDIKV